MAAVELPAAVCHHREQQVPASRVAVQRVEPVALELPAALAMEHPEMAEAVATAARVALLPAGLPVVAARAALLRAALADRAVTMAMRLVARAVRVRAAV